MASGLRLSVKIWGQDGKGKKQALELIEMMWRTCMQELENLLADGWRTAMCDSSWLRQLADAATRHLQSECDEKRSCENLFGLGQRNYAFFGPGLSTVPILGLTDSSFLELLKPGKRIEYLRNIAPNYQRPDEMLVLRTCEKKGSDIVTLQIATAIAGGSDHVRRKRWVYKTWDSDRATKTRVLPEVGDAEELLSLEPRSLRPMEEGRCFRWENPPMEILEILRSQCSE